MELKDLKKEIARLGPREQEEVTAFLFHLRRSSDPEYQRNLRAREGDREKSHWLTPDAFEARLDQD